MAVPRTFNASPPAHPDASTNAYPLALPSPPLFRQVDLESLELDDHLLEDEVPLVFVSAALRAMGKKDSPFPFIISRSFEVNRDFCFSVTGAVLLESVLKTTIDRSTTATPPSLAATTRRFSPPPSPLPHPNFLLDLHFSDAPKEHTYVPIHGLPWALISPRLGGVSCSHSFDNDDGDDAALTLPVLPLTLPSKLSFALLHDFIYTFSSATLLAGLLQRESQFDGVQECVFRLERVRSLWSNAVALEISDETFWSTLRRAWSVLILEAEEAMLVEGGGEGAE
jgi:hypothetical protein